MVTAVDNTLCEEHLSGSPTVLLEAAMKSMIGIAACQWAFFPYDTAAGASLAAVFLRKDEENENAGR